MSSTYYVPGAAVIVRKYGFGDVYHAIDRVKRVHKTGRFTLLGQGNTQLSLRSDGTAYGRVAQSSIRLDVQPYSADAWDVIKDAERERRAGAYRLQAERLIDARAYGARMFGQRKIDAVALIVSILMDERFLDLVTHLGAQKAFSAETFGPGPRTEGVCRHIEKELAEVRASSGTDLEEWVDVATLAFDGAMRAGFEPSAVAMALADKLSKNKARTWPDWRTLPPDAPIEHDRSAPVLGCDGTGELAGLPGAQGETTYAKGE